MGHFYEHDEVKPVFTSGLARGYRAVFNDKFASIADVDFDDPLVRLALEDAVAHATRVLFGEVGSVRGAREIDPPPSLTADGLVAALGKIAPTRPYLQEIWIVDRPDLYQQIFSLVDTAPFNDASDAILVQPSGVAIIPWSRNWHDATVDGVLPYPHVRKQQAPEPWRSDVRQLAPWFVYIAGVWGVMSDGTAAWVDMGVTDATFTGGDS